MVKVLNESKREVEVASHKVMILRYAENVVLIAGAHALQELMPRVKRGSEASGLYLNTKKTKDIKIYKGTDQTDNTHININNFHIRPDVIPYQYMTLYDPNSISAPSILFLSFYLFSIYPQV